jgi:hypothetical protein
VSGGTYGDTTELTQKLEARLRELAGAQLTPWIKVGQLVFPGVVVRRNRSGEVEFEIQATVRELAIRQAMEEIGSWRAGVSTDRLTWATNTQRIRSLEAEVRATAATQSEVTFMGQLSDQDNSSRSVMSDVTMELRDGRRLAPADQAAMWARHAAFGDDIAELPDATDRAILGREKMTLPGVPTANGARGWLAEGLVRLYLVEGLIARFGGGFEHLEIGPSTAMSVRAKAIFRPGGFQPPAVAIEGLVPLP